MYRGDSCVDVSHNNALAMAKELSEVNRCFVYRSLQCPERVERANFITLPLYSESKYGAWTTAYEYNGVYSVATSVPVCHQDEQQDTDCRQ